MKNRRRKPANRDVMVGRGPRLPCMEGFKRHRFRHDGVTLRACFRCGAPNPHLHIVPEVSHVDHKRQPQAV